METQNERTEEVKAKPVAEKHDHSIVGKIFWGLLLVLIGGLLLAANFGLAEVNWSNLWRLWPLFIIAAGLSVLALKHIIWRIFLILVALATLGVIAWSLLVGMPETNNSVVYEESVKVSSAEITRAEVNIMAGAGNIDITTTTQSEIAKAKLESGVTELTKKVASDSSEQSVTFSMDTKNKNWWLGPVKNDLSVDITRDLPVSLNVQAGASDVNIDMSEAKLTSMGIKIGASTLTVKLGDNQVLSDVNIESGASTIDLRVPDDSGVRLKIESGISTKDIDNLTEVSPGIFESPKYADAKNKIDIVAKIGAATFTIERY